jgi:hypothetical protein
MDIGSLLIVLAIIVLGGAYLAWPLLRRAGLPASGQQKKLSSLEAERDRILAIISEMDMDHAMGKIEAQDFEAQRGDLMRRGAAILREIDALGEAPGSASPPSQAMPEHVAEEALDARLEQEVARLRQSMAQQALGHCPQCGQMVLASDLFCSHCGRRLALGAEK